MRLGPAQPCVKNNESRLCWLQMAMSGPAARLAAVDRKRWMLRGEEPG